MKTVIAITDNRSKPLYQILVISVVSLITCLSLIACGSSSDNASATPPAPVDLMVYNNLEQIESHLVWLAQQPNTTLETLGHSVEGKPILALQRQSSLPSARDIVIVAGQHAREWIAPATTLLAADYFTSDAPELTAITGSLNLWFVVVANPDGYQHSAENDRLWRKNRRAITSDTYGVDLNRNFPTFWAQHRSSATASADTYHGTGPLSEPEADAIAGLINRLNPIAVFDIHSFAQCIHVPTENNRAKMISTAMVLAMTDASGDSYTSNTVNLPYYGGSLFEWADSLNDVDGYLVELLPNTRNRDRYPWIGNGRSAFEPPPEEIEASWIAMQAGLMSAFTSYAEL